ncbi:MAG: FAD-dependent oxidoreductase [Erysipelotrichales bacterium]|nr:FAD-dependent oxidoreductase [Erysipelotrichales bacterium]
MKTYWNKDLEPNTFPKLDKDITTNILIVGGGLCGLLCAYKLEERNINYVLVEADTIGGKASAANTGKITAQHGLIYHRLIESVGEIKAKQYLDANLDAVKEYRHICKGLDVDFENQSAYCYSLNNREVLEKELNALKILKYEADLVDELPLPFKNVGAIRFKEQACFNPAKFCQQISKGLSIYEHTKIVNFDKDIACTEAGHKIHAKRIIITTHFPFIDSLGLYFMKMYQERIYGIFIDNVKRFEGMYIDESNDGLSLRFHKDHLLIYGGDKRVGNSDTYFKQARTFARFHFPYSKEITTIANEDCITLDEIPYIGEYSTINQKLLVATGFSKWGITHSLIAANVLCDIIENKPNPLIELYKPSRMIVPSSLASHLFESTKSMLRPTTKRCTHLGCGLVYNPAEDSWDCPCHGSRFNEEGEILDGPATKELK